MNVESFYSARLSDEEFEKLSSFIFKNYGIKMPYNKKLMLEGRLHKRLKINNITDFKTYLEFLFSDTGKRSELVHMIDVVTTNKTDFFREPHHFEYLEKNVLPKWNEQGVKKIDFWSAACSTGEEPYTIAIMMDRFIQKHGHFGYEVFATDLSSRVLKSSVNAVYNSERIMGIPIEVRNEYFLKSKDPKNKTVRVVKKLRDKIAYKRLNFMDQDYHIQKQFDVIFCRNVLIYFNKKTQEAVLQKICRYLKSGGYLFLGHSESVNYLDVPLNQMQPTIFKRI